MVKNHIRNIVEVDELPDNYFEIHEVFGHKMNRYYYDQYHLKFILNLYEEINIEL